MKKKHEFTVICLIGNIFLIFLLQCVAKISSVYWQSNEESVESDKHQRIPVLESRETVVPKSRFLDKSLEGK